MVSDDLVNDEPKELLGERRVKPRVLGELAKMCNLDGLAIRVGRRQAHNGLVFPDALGDLEPFGQKVNQRRVDVVDAGSAVSQYGVVIHGASVLPATVGSRVSG